jgi:hypothetical protein
VTARQLALDCDPTWTDPEPDDDDGPRCTLDLNLGGQQANPQRLATMTTINPIGGYL